MSLFERKPPLPDELLPAWQAFRDCAEVVEGGRRTLLATLPVGRVEPAPIAVGVDALATSLRDALTWMDAWHDVGGLAQEWSDCAAAIDQSAKGLDRVRQVAANPGELELLQGAVEDVIAPLDTFADAWNAWRRRWRLPR